MFNQAGAVQNTDTVTRQGGGTLGNEPLTLSAQGQTPGYVGLSDDDDDEKKSSEPESPIIPVAGGLFLNTETGEYINNYVDEGATEAGQESGGSNDYYIDPDDYENPEDYAKAMVIGSRNSMRNGDSDEFLAANKYPTGAEGLFALHKDAKETLGELGFAVFSDELNQQDAANSTANGQTAGAGAQETQAAGAETQGNQGGQTGQAATTEAQGTQPAQTQGTEPVSADTPVFTLYAPDEDEKTNIDPVVNLEGEAYLKSLERLGAVLPEGGQNGDGDGYVSFNNSVPAWEEVEKAYQDAQAASEAESARAERMREKYAINMWEQFNNVDSLLHMDAFLKDHGFSTGAQGYMEVWQTVEGVLGKDEFAALRERLEPDSTAIITAPTTLCPEWEGRRGRQLYTDSIGRDYSEFIFGDSNSEDTIECLKSINENTPIAGGLSEIIDLFEDKELRMITRTYEITTEEINRMRVAQTESTLKGVAGIPGFIMELYSIIRGGMNYNDSADVTNDIFKDYGMENITGQVDAESICHAIADFLTPKISGNETYTREETTVYCFTPNRLKGEGYTYYKMKFTFDYTPYAWHYAKVNHEEYYNNYE